MVLFVLLSPNFLKLLLVHILQFKIQKGHHWIFLNFWRGSQHNDEFLFAFWSQFQSDFLCQILWGGVFNEPAIMTRLRINNQSILPQFLRLLSKELLIHNYVIFAWKLLLFNLLLLLVKQIFQVLEFRILTADSLSVVNLSSAINSKFDNLVAVSQVLN